MGSALQFIRKNLWRNIIAGAAVFVFLLLMISQPESCSRKTEKMTVRGSSLEGVLSNGDEINVALGYYNCRPVKRGDIIVLPVGLNGDKVVKVVRAVPGDTWALPKQPDGSHAIMINGQLLRTTTGLLYALDAKRVKLLQLYVNDYNGMIPEKAYLVLGNQQFGSRDSSSFGLVSSNDFIGKVLR